MFGIAYHMYWYILGQADGVNVCKKLPKPKSTFYEKKIDVKDTWMGLGPGICKVTTP